MTAVLRLLRHRSAQIALAVWAASVAFVAVSGRRVPFDWPNMPDMSTKFQLISAHLQILLVFLLIGLTLLVTRRRAIVDLASRAPAAPENRAELTFLVAYAVVAQVAGLGLGRALGSYPISFHLPGSVFGISTPVSPRDVYLWVGFNFLAYAAIPYAFFRRRGYSNEALSLKSADRRADFRLILTILLVESAFELAFDHSIFRLSGRQALVGGSATLVIYLLGTSLPTMVFIYAILLPRYLKATGSIVTTVILGGVTYAALHLFEAWTLWNSPTNVTLSLIFLMFQYFGPGMVKSVLTLRSGNAWVHVWSYHSLAPHVWMDSPLIVRMFGVR